MRGKAFSITRPQLHIGRAMDTDVRIADPHVSRHHALIRYLNGKVMIEDTESSSGVIVNGIRLTGPRLLRAGDRVRLGAVELEMSPASGDPQLDDQRANQPAPTAATGHQAGRVKPVGLVLLAVGLMCAVIGWAKWASPTLECVKNAQAAGTSFGSCISPRALLTLVGAGVLTTAGIITVIVNLFVRRGSHRYRARP